jgi:hypothetical protein
MPVLCAGRITCGAFREVSSVCGESAVECLIAIA